MAKSKARHRAKWRPLEYPLQSYIRMYQNRWWHFQKPALKRKVSLCLKHVSELIKKLSK